MTGPDDEREAVDAFLDSAISSLGGVGAALEVSGASQRRAVEEPREDVR